MSSPVSDEPVALPLAIRRGWRLYAFQAAHEVTDHAGIELGPNELAQLVAATTSALREKLANAEDALDRHVKLEGGLLARIAALQDANDILKRDLVVAQMGKT